MTTETKWTPTRRGGFRRQPQAGVAQKMGKRKLKDRGTETEGSADPKAEEAWTSVTTSEERLPNMEKVVGSNPAPGTSFALKFNEKLGLDTCPYLIRWRLETPWGSIRLHHWLGQDDPRNKHDHAWNFITFVIKGGYTDLGADGDQHLRAPAVQYRSATHQHTVVPDEGGAWTIIITGPKIREWGFWVDGKFRSRLKYFWKFGHHPCD